MIALLRRIFGKDRRWRNGAVTLSMFRVERLSPSEEVLQVARCAALAAENRRRVRARRRKEAGIC